MDIQNVTMGQLVKMWQDGKAVSITLCVTEACNFLLCYGLYARAFKKNANFAIGSD